VAFGFCIVDLKVIIAPATAGPDGTDAERPTGARTEGPPPGGPFGFSGEAGLEIES
jgi:hypothetical protein